MAETASIRVVKQFTYRGIVRNFSNRYHFTGGTPADSAHWTTFSDNVVTAEKAIYRPLASAGAKIVATFGYASGSDIPVFTKTYATDGTLAGVNFGPMPGDAAAVVRYATADRSSKNHPIYCFNYWHTPFMDASTLAPDTLHATQKSAMTTYAALWVTGISDGAETLIRSRPNGHVVTGVIVEPLISHRDLPR